MKRLMTTVNLMILNWLKNNLPANRKTRGTDREQSVRGLWLLVIAAFLLAAFCSGFGVRIARVQGASMEPTLYHNDWILSLPQAYRKAPPERGDVVLIRRRALTQGYIVKRIIGLPGENIEIRDGNVLVNNVSIYDPFTAGCEDTMQPIFVEPGCYFVLGDNRTQSRDSRDWEDPLVHEEELRGKVWFLLFPKVIKMQ